MRDKHILPQIVSFRDVTYSELIELDLLFAWGLY